MDQMNILFYRDTDLKVWGHPVTDAPLSEVDLFTIRDSSSLTFISRDFSVAVNRKRKIFMKR